MIFSMITQDFFPNSMIFPYMDFYLVIFHDFQSLWQPLSNINLFACRYLSIKIVTSYVQ